MTTTIIATRESRLALWQAGHVQALLQERLGLHVELLPMTTSGWFLSVARPASCCRFVVTAAMMQETCLLA